MNGAGETSQAAASATTLARQQTEHGSEDLVIVNMDQSAREQRELHKDVVEDPVFGRLREDGPNYRNVYNYRRADFRQAEFGHEDWILTVPGPVDPHCSPDDEDPDRDWCIIYSWRFQYIGSRTWGHHRATHFHCNNLV